MTDLLACARRELMRRKGRSLANILGYFLAVGIMVVMLNVLLFSKHAESSILSGTGTHFMLFAPSCGEIASLTPNELASLALGIKPKQCEGKCKECTGCAKKPIDLKNEAFLAQTTTTKLLPIKMIGEVMKHTDLFLEASPYLLFRFKSSGDGHLFTVGGFDPASKQVVGTTCCAKGDIIEGKFITPEDSGVVILEAGYAQGRGLKVGSTVQVASLSYQVIGIVNPGVRPGKADMYMNYKDAEKVISTRIKTPLLDEMNVMLVQVTSAEKQDAAIAKIKEIMQEGVVSSYACYKPAVEVMGMNESAVWLITLVLALGAAFLSMKSQLTSVIERRHDIGILKAIGWTNRNVVSQIFAESVIQSLIGGFLGCLVGVLVIWFVPIKSIMGIQANVSPFVSIRVLIAGLGLALAGGIFAGIVPAFSAATQSPAEALRRI